MTRRFCPFPEILQGYAFICQSEGIIGLFPAYFKQQDCFCAIPHILRCSLIVMVCVLS